MNERQFEKIVKVKKDIIICKRNFVIFHGCNLNFTTISILLVGDVFKTIFITYFLGNILHASTILRIRQFQTKGQTDSLWLRCSFPMCENTTLKFCFMFLLWHKNETIVIHLYMLWRSTIQLALVFNWVFAFSYHQSIREKKKKLLREKLQYKYSYIDLLLRLNWSGSTRKQ